VTVEIPDNKEIRFRFAPSPTGGVHIGTARTALFNYIAARSMGAKLVLRIEDTDRKRSSASFEQSILEDLHWLGIKWDAFYRQSERFALYAREAKRLVDSSSAYYCFCSAERIAQVNQKLLSEGKMPGYDRKCLGLSKEEIKQQLKIGTPYTIRFQIPETVIEFEDIIRGNIRFASSVLSDFVLLKSDKSPSYNFAVVVDDHDMHITHVLRGEDHITNTARQIMLFQSLGYALPAFAHLSMILASDGTKLSKRHGATTIGQFRDIGYLSASLANYLSLLSWSPRDGSEMFDLGQAISQFDLKDVSKTPAIFDIDKLNWLNGLYIRSKSDQEIAGLLTPYLLKEKIVSKDQLSQETVCKKIIKCANAFKDKIKVLSEIGPFVKPLFDDNIKEYEENTQEIAKLEAAKRVTALFVEKLQEAIQDNHAKGRIDPDEISEEDAAAIIRGMADALKGEGIKGKYLYMPIRIYLCGNEHGPDLPKIISILGLHNCIQRIQSSYDYFFQPKG
jgi:nondiscriminating glutamyl-tRNA synthetase